MDGRTFVLLRGKEELARHTVRAWRLDNQYMTTKVDAAFELVEEFARQSKLPLPTLFEALSRVLSEDGHQMPEWPSKGGVASSYPPRSPEPRGFWAKVLGKIEVAIKRKVEAGGLPMARAVKRKEDK